MTTLFFEKALLSFGWQSNVLLIVADGVIARIETDAAPQGERHAIGLPGMPNLHSHAFQRAMAGFAEKRGATRDSFWTWRDLMYRFAWRIGPDELRAIAALAYMEMLERGFTRVGEFHYLHHDLSGGAFDDPAEMAAAVCAASADTGIGLTLLPVFYAHAGFGGQAAEPLQGRFICDLDRFDSLLSSARGHVAWLNGGRLGIAPHSLRAVTGRELVDLIPMAGDGPIHIHIAEQTKEVADCLTATGQRPVEWLLDHALVDSRWCLVHATHMTNDEAARLARTGAVAGLCPITEANLGDGVFPAADFLANEGRFGIGSDSNVLINAAEELRLLEYSQRLSQYNRNVCATGGRSTGATLFSDAIVGGAQALDVRDGIQVGGNADLISLDPNHEALLGRDGDDLIDAYVFAASRSPIDCVWRHGRKWVLNGKHVARTAILEDYKKALCRLTS